MSVQLRAARVMLSFAWQADRRRSVLAFVTLAVQALSGALFAFWLKLLLDGIAAHDTTLAVSAAALLAASVSGQVALDYAGSRLRQSLSERAHHLVERRLLDTVGRTPTLEIHETPEHLTQLELLRAEGWEFGEVIPSILDLMRTVIRVAMVATLLASVHPLLLLLPLFGIPLLALSQTTSDLYDRGTELAAEPNRRAGALWDLATSAGPAKEVRLFRLRDEILDRFHREHRDIRAIHQRLQIRGQAIGLLARVFFLAGYFGAILFVADQATRGLASTGDVALTAILAGQVLGLVGASAERVQWALRTLTAAGRFVYLDAVAQRTLVAAAARPPTRLHTGLRLNGVSYRYPGGILALSDVDLELPAGSTVAIVGDNGAGKTTLVKLLAGLYLPTSGHITADGIDLSTVDPEKWRHRISAGFQDHARMEFVVRETVGSGDLSTMDSDEAVHVALDRAGAADLMDDLPHGLDTQLGPSWPGGIDLSGGQWQKLAIGRAMMRTTPLLLLLDEPTAALDSETEHRLFSHWTSAAATARMASGAVTVLVSHRFSTVRMADLIVVLAGGRIVELGSHDELIAAGGTYSELFEIQAASYR